MNPNTDRGRGYILCESILNLSAVNVAPQESLIFLNHQKYENIVVDVVLVARSAYYVPLAHQEPASAAVRRAPASGQISKWAKKWTVRNGFKS